VDKPAHPPIVIPAWFWPESSLLSDFRYPEAPLIGSGTGIFDPLFLDTGLPLAGMTVVVGVGAGGSAHINWCWKPVEAVLCYM